MKAIKTLEYVIRPVLVNKEERFFLTRRIVDEDGTVLCDLLLKYQNGGVFFPNTEVAERSARRDAPHRVKATSAVLTQTGAGPGQLRLTCFFSSDADRCDESEWACSSELRY